MRKNIYWPWVIILTIMVNAACNNSSPGKTSTDSTAVTQPDSAALPAGDNSRNSLDWAGTYKGIVPCADCEGIETTITISTDAAYTMVTNYLGKKEAKPIERKGKFSWNTAGSSIILEGITDAPAQYLVGEGKLIQLDMNGQRITGVNADKYELKKL